MSYKVKEKKDFLNELFSRLVDFNNISPNLLSAATFEEFEVWFEKLEKIDRRSLYLFLKNHKEEIDKDYLKMVSDRFVYLLL